MICVTRQRAWSILFLALCVGGSTACSRDASYDGRTAEQWLSIIRTGDSSSRQRATDAITELPVGAASVLVHAMHDSSVYVRRGVAHALGHLRDENDGEVEALVDATYDADDSVRTLAVLSLGERSAAARAALPRIRELAVKPGSQRVAALSVLPNIDTESRSLLSIYLPALTDTSAAVRAVGVEMLLAAGGDSRMIPTITHALSDTNAIVRLAAAHVLASEAHHDSVAYTAMIGQRNSVDVAVRRIADSVRVNVAPPR